MTLLLQRVNQYRITFACSLHAEASVLTAIVQMPIHFHCINRRYIYMITKRVIDPLNITPVQFPYHVFMTDFYFWDVVIHPVNIIWFI